DKGNVAASPHLNGSTTASINRSRYECCRLVERTGMSESLEEDLTAPRKDHLDRMRHSIKRQPLNDAREAKAMIAVKVGDRDVRDLRRADARQDHLSLSPLAGIEENAEVVPLEEDTVVVTTAGRYLTRGPKKRDSSRGHDAPPGLWLMSPGHIRIGEVQ